MRAFSSIDAFTRHLAGRVALLGAAGTKGLEQGARIIEAEAKRSIGRDDNGWAPLSPATLNGFDLDGRHIPGKIELGFSPPDNPLLREGRLRDSYQHTTQGHEAVVGSDDEVAVYQELGTPNARFPIPPRPVLGGAAHRKAEEVVEAVAKATLRVFT
jgi:hypothetical protein